MNANFIDIAATISTQLKTAASYADIGRSLAPAGCGTGVEGRFQQTINRIIASQGSKSGSKAGLQSSVKTTMDASVRAQLKSVSTVVSNTVESMEGSMGPGFVSKLEAIFRKLSGGTLEGVSLNIQGLDALKKLLVKAGGDPGEVAALIEELKGNAETGTLPIKDVLKRLSDLSIEVDEKADTETAYMETSALPFVKTLLKEIGLTAEEVGAIVEEADKGNSGISINVVVEALKTAKANADGMEKNLTVTDTDNNFKTLMAKLNLPVTQEEQETVSINDLIQAFEAFKGEKSGEASARKLSEASLIARTGGSDSVQNLSENSLSILKAQANSESMGQLLDTLLQSVSLASEIAPPSFSYHQVKDQLVNGLMVSDENKTDQLSLFAQPAAGEDAKADKLSLEMVTLLSKDGGKASKSSGNERIPSVGGKETKNKATNIADIVAQRGGGTDLDATSGNASRAKATSRALPSYVTNQVGRGIVRAVNQGESSIKLHLKPPELGRLTMTIDHHSTGIKVNIVTENHAARDILASNVNELKSALNSAGISLDSFDVDMNSDFKQSMANTGNQAGQFGRRNGNRQGTDFNSPGGEAVEEISPSEGSSTIDSSVHFVA